MISRLEIVRFKKFTEEEKTVLKSDSNGILEQEGESGSEETPTKKENPTNESIIKMLIKTGLMGTFFSCPDKNFLREWMEKAAKELKSELIEREKSTEVERTNGEGKNSKQQGRKGEFPDGPDD